MVYVRQRKNMNSLRNGIQVCMETRHRNVLELGGVKLYRKTPAALLSTFNNIKASQDRGSFKFSYNMVYLCFAKEMCGVFSKRVLASSSGG